MEKRKKGRKDKEKGNEGKTAISLAGSQYYSPC
jgi:hypothetical protein